MEYNNIGIRFFIFLFLYFIWKSVVGLYYGHQVAESLLEYKIEKETLVMQTDVRMYVNAHGPGQLATYQHAWPDLFSAGLPRAKTS